jgi:hypothetical protein
MKGKHIGYDDEVSSSSAVDVKNTAQLNDGARERFATGKNSTKRHKSKGKPVGKKGAKGHPS